MRRVASRWLCGFAWILSLSLIAGCAPTRPDSQDRQVIRASVALDHALVPALWYTGRAERSRAGPATIALARAWQQFQVEQAPVLASSAAGRRQMRDITGRVARANLAVNMNGQLDRAHELLEGARRDLRQLRVDAGIHFYPDAVTAYHAVLEEMGRAVERDDRQALESQVRRADSIWNEVEATPLDAELYGLSTDDADYIAKLVLAERAELSRLQPAIRGKVDRIELRRLLTDLRAPVKEITLVMGGVDRP